MRKPFGPHHSNILDAVSPRSRGVLHAVAAPRGGGKTTIHTICILHHVVYKEFSELLGLPPNDFIVVVGETDGAYDIVDNVRANLETNDALIADFGNLVGPTWGRERTRTANNCYILPRSRNSRIRGLNDLGRRPALVIVSDVQKGRDVESPLIREKDWRWYTSDVRRLEGNEEETQASMNMLIEGTVLHEDAILAKCLKNPAYSGGKYPAVNEWSDRNDLWDKWKSLYTDLADENRRGTALEFYYTHKAGMLKGVDLLWPQGLSYYRCMEMIVSEGMASFLREMQQDPHDPDRYLFNMEKALKFDVEDWGILRDDGRRIPWESLNGVSIFLDWAGGKDSQKNCFAAVVAVAWHGYAHTDELEAYVIDVWIDRKPMSEQIKACFDFIKSYTAYEIRLGTEHPGPWLQSLRDDFERERVIRKAKGHPYEHYPRFISRNENKLNRIASMESRISARWIGFSRKLPSEFIDQLRLFPTHEFVDGPDALEGALLFPVDYKPPMTRREKFLRRGETDESDRHMLSI